ncbi:MAG: Mrp/NBP35 family ATP-binding protein [Thermodesulfovibrionales bacterium]|nr:Mrp/NBP35 family ATP-binding protein [Thermodesulfovibrionales bacterium]
MSKENECKSGEVCPSKKTLSREEIEDLKERLALQDNLSGVKHKIIVLSGKGGVGKSTIATNIAAALSMKGKKAGLIDIDIHGPSIPKMLGLEGRPLRGSEEGMLPIDYSDNLKVISIGFILRTQNDAVIWRAPLKHSLIRQFLRDVRWGELDYLVIDSPPGTGDEPLSVIQLLEDADGAIVVTTPQDVALADVRKAITFCRQVNLPIIGVIENMSGFVCPYCGKTVDIFKSGGGQKMALEMGVPFLGKIPIEPKIVETGDSGKPYLQYYHDSETSKAFDLVITPLLALSDERKYSENVKTCMRCKE